MTHNNGEPIETRTPWTRNQRPLGNPAQHEVDHERQHPIVSEVEPATIHPLVRPGTGKVEQHSILTDEYEPNRPMAPAPDSIIAKKGLRPTDIYKPVDVWDKVVVGVVLFCLVGIAGVITALVVRF